MKKVFVVLLAFVCATSFAEDKPEEATPAAAAAAADGERPKTFKRLIPADVLRGKLIVVCVFRNCCSCVQRYLIVIHNKRFKQM